MLTSWARRSMCDELRRPASPVGLVAGVLATITMDAAMVFAALLAPDTFASDRIDLAMIGRWAGASRAVVGDMTTSPPSFRCAVNSAWVLRRTT